MRIGHGVLATGLVVGLAGCTMVGRRTTATPHPTATAPTPWQETYGGSVDLQGRTMPVTLELKGPGDASVEGVLRIDAIDLTAQGRGVRADGAIHLELSYSGACAGTTVVEVRSGAGGDTLAGTLSAADCTGTESGRVRLLRRGSDVCLVERDGQGA